MKWILVILIMPQTNIQDSTVALEDYLTYVECMEARIPDEDMKLLTDGSKDIEVKQFCITEDTLNIMFTK